MSHPLTVKGVVLDRHGAVLLARNHRGEWELPGGRPEPGESHQAAVAREIAEETGLAVDVGERLAAWRFEVVPGRRVDVVAYACTLRGDRPPVPSAEHEDVRFVAAGELGSLPLPGGYGAAIDAATARAGGQAVPSRR